MTGNTSPQRPFKEGDVYKTVTAGGHTFILRYGYYEDYERAAGEPVVVYPDLELNRMYSTEGYRLVTAIQDVCVCYEGKNRASEDACCSECVYYPNTHACIDICTCEQNRQTVE